MTDSPEQLQLFREQPELLSVGEIFERANQALLVELLEDRRIERKPPGYEGRALGDYISMWANTAPDGGIVVLGMEDDGAVTGCGSLHTSALNKIEKAPSIYCPEARVEMRRVPVRRTTDGGDDFLLLFRVHYHEKRVVETGNHQAFMRRGDSKTRLTDDEKLEIRISKGEVALELTPCGLPYPDAFDTNAIGLFAASYRRLHGKDISDEAKILEGRRLGRVRDGKFEPNLACALLFAQDPLLIIPGAKMVKSRFLCECDRQHRSCSGLEFGDAPHC
jgi:ATP-dependent DNA helicase RecG